MKKPKQEQTATLPTETVTLFRSEWTATELRCNSCVYMAFGERWLNILTPCQRIKCLVTSVVLMSFNVLTEYAKDIFIL